MTVVGVTGKYCAGKDTLTDLLVDHGYVEIDVDGLGHRALEECQGAIAAAFGPDVLGTDGAIDRKALGARVFADPEKLARLESIVHPPMVEMTATRIAELRDSPAPPPGVVVNAAVMFRMGIDRLCDTILYVHASFVTRVRRARLRDNATLGQVIRRLRSQRDVDPQYSSSDADIHSVRNDGDREQLQSRVRRLLPLSDLDGEQWSSTRPFSS